MTLYSSLSPSSSPVVSSVTSLPWRSFFGMMYSDIGANSSKVGPVGDGERETTERSRDREAERDRASSVNEDGVMRLSGTWCRTVGPSLGSKTA